MSPIIKNAFAPLALCAALAPVSAVIADTVETEILHNNTYQVAGSVLCQLQGACALSFPATEHIQTVITSVNCSVGILAGATLNYAQLYYGSFDGFVNVQPIINMPTFYVESSDGRTSLGVNVATTFFIPKGHAPTIEMGTNSLGVNYLSMHCTLSGYHS